MIFHWRFSDSKSPQVSRTLLSILVVFNNAVVWMVSSRAPTSKSCSPFNNPLVSVSKSPISIGIVVTFMFHSFFQFSCKVEVLISLSTFFQFYSVVNRDSKVDKFADFLFFCLLLLLLLLIAIIIIDLMMACVLGRRVSYLKWIIQMSTCFRDWVPLYFLHAEGGAFEYFSLSLNLILLNFLFFCIFLFFFIFFFFAVFSLRSY